ncbi:putative transcriptional regulator [Deinococcus maricopensis DSM 21211]|uniref:Putative transcriptional regulator n=1 Tax=Deinococcus maricopensis (strain DSM 21211 / LMG 22137 / NRRL B-23946 / LB-34) TaxID=709986 RepID=E8U8I6_DEIML|nr:putative transcriptional regulator [Deinococcus maricopensis DSM 21211]
MVLPVDISPQDLARYAVALSNTKGGTIVVGVGKNGVQDASDIHPLQVTHAIFELSGGKLSVNVQHHRVPGEDVRVLLIFVPQAPYVLAAPDGEVVAWDGAHLVPVTGATSDRVVQLDYTSTVPPTGSLSDLDPVEVARLRAMGQRGALAQLADLDFLSELGLIVDVQGEWRPTIAGILLAGTPRALRTFVAQAEVCYYHHATSDVEFQFREDLLRPLASLLARLHDLIQARNAFTPVQVGLFRIEVWDFDEAVYREALLNALTHRDYTVRDVVHVHHFPDRLEISNPGGFPGGITSENVLRHQPKRRNPLLAEVLAKLGFVERAGVGVDKMYQLMLRHGKEPPEFTTYPDAVTLALHNPGFDAEFVRFVARKQEEMQTLSLDMLIVLSVLKREGEVSRAHLAEALQLPEDRTPRLLQMMEDRGLIAHTGRGTARLYELSADSRAALKRAVSSVAPMRMAPARPGAPARVPAGPREVALELARREEGVGNADLREACGLNTQQAWRVLNALCTGGHIEKRGSGHRTARYYVSGQADRPR